MIVNCVSVSVKREHLEVFIAATKKNHRGSVAEAGNLRFDVLECEEDPTRFLLYEAFESPEAAQVHRDTPHYREWNEAVNAWMAAPREKTRYTILFPGERSAW